MNAEEYEAIASRATAAGMTVPSYLVAAGQVIDMSPRAYGSSEWKVKREPLVAGPQRRSWAAEMVGLSRVVRRAGENLNQLTRYAHTDRRRPDELPEALAELRGVAAAARQTLWLRELCWVLSRRFDHVTSTGGRGGR